MLTISEMCIIFGSLTFAGSPPEGVANFAEGIANFAEFYQTSACCLEGHIRRGGKLACCLCAQYNDREMVAR